MVYFKRYRGWLNLKDPKTFDEKIQWLKLHDRRGILRIVADKYRFREYISLRVGDEYNVPLYLVTENVEDLNIRKVGLAPCVVKPNHSSQKVIFVRDPANADWQTIRSRALDWVQECHFWHEREWQYQGIPRKIIVEKILLSEDGNLPKEYKLFCFHGKAKLIQVVLNRYESSSEKCINYYEISWKRIEGVSGKTKDCGPRDIPRPKELDQMIQIAEKLAIEFVFLRVDFYIVKGRLYIGELTLTPNGGFFFSDISNELNDKFGSMIKLPPEPLFAVLP